MSELLDRESEIREAAKSCVTVMDLCQLILVKGKPAPISFIAAADETFKLGLEWVRPNKLPPKAARECPKPVKGSKAKPKGGEE